MSAPHPRLLPLGIPLSEIQKRAQDPRYERIVKAIKRQADGFCKLNPQKPNMEVEDPLRSLGDAPQWLLVAYVIETDPAAKAVYKENLYRYVNLLLDWGLPKQDLPVAHAQLSLALTYDWLYNELPKELRDRIRLRLIEAARYAIGLEWVGCYMWRYGQFLANHNWFVHKIMGLAAVTLWTEDGDPLKPGELKNLLDEMVANFYFVEGVHSADGHPVEGPLYQDYGLRPFYDVATIITPLLNMKYDMLKAPVIKEQAPARLSTLLPGTTGFMVYSDSKPEQYSGALKEVYDYYDLKGLLESFFEKCRIGRVEFIPVNGDSRFAPGVAAEIKLNGKSAGFLGEVNPDFVKGFRTGNKIYYAELEASVLSMMMRPAGHYKAISQFPATTRDVALVADESLNCVDIINLVYGAKLPNFESVKLFDIFRDDNMKKAGKKSMAFQVTFRNSERTLTDEEVNTAFNKLRQKLADTLKVELR